MNKAILVLKKEKACDHVQSFVSENIQKATNSFIWMYDR